MSQNWPTEGRGEVGESDFRSKGEVTKYKENRGYVSFVLFDNLFQDPFSSDFGPHRCMRSTQVSLRSKMPGWWTDLLNSIWGSHTFFFGELKEKKKQ